MFDPLDLYTAAEESVESSENQADFFLDSSHVNNDSNHVNDINDKEDNLAIDCFDLPLVHSAPPEAILCILRLLGSTDQVNFQSSKTSNLSVTQICHQKGISMELISATEKYYQEWGNRRLDSITKICTQIPTLAVTDEELLKYYTLVLKHYCETNSSDFRDLIVKEVSMRISENCGRMALPSISRKFSLEGLPKCVEIYEPSLTADNLGWKTWGSSLILAQKLIKLIPNLVTRKRERALELGSGTGLAGIAWLMKWTEVHGKDSDIEMFLTDLKEIVPNLKRNVETNALVENSVVDTLDWNYPADFINKYSNQKFDTIIVSDPIYSPNHPRLVVDMITLFLAPDGVCHLQIPLRDKYSKEREELWTLLEKNNLRIMAQEKNQSVDDWGEVNYLYQRIEWKK